MTSPFGNLVYGIHRNIVMHLKVGFFPATQCLMAYLMAIVIWCRLSNVGVTVWGFLTKDRDNAIDHWSTDPDWLPSRSWMHLLTEPKVMRVFETLNGFDQQCLGVFKGHWDEDACSRYRWNNFPSVSWCCKWLACIRNREQQQETFQALSCQLNLQALVVVVRLYSI